MSEEIEKKGKLSSKIAWKLVVLLIAIVKMISSLLEVSDREATAPEPVQREERTERKEVTDSIVAQYKEVDVKDLYYVENYLTDKLEYIEEKEEILTTLGEGYEKIVALQENCLNFAAQKDGRWGMVSVDGSVLIPFRYERVSEWNKSGWIEFERNGQFFVYDTNGEMQRAYTNKMQFRMESEEAYLYRTGIGYMAGMQVMTTIPEILEDEYYGIRYSTISPNEVMYEAVGDYWNVGMFTFPDETGRAVAIQGDGKTNTIYYLTEQGCESKVLTLPEGINGRWFDFVGDYTWADHSLSHGWLKVLVGDALPGFLKDDYKYYLAFFNVETFEIVPFPEEYQNFYMIANAGYGDAMAISADEADENGYYTYAICKGNRVLTEEKYYWVEFGEKYMTAGSEDAIEILDYDGNVLASYWDVGGRFVNGKMVVSDGAGVWLIDENLEPCMDYYIAEGPIDGCFEYGIIVDGMYYALKELAE